MVVMRIDRFEYSFYFSSCEGIYILRQYDIETKCVEFVAFGFEKAIQYVNELINEINEIVDTSKNDLIIKFLLETKKDYESLKRQIEKLAK